MTGGQSKHVFFSVLDSHSLLGILPSYIEKISSIILCLHDIMVHYLRHVFLTILAQTFACNWFVKMLCFCGIALEGLYQR
jgi:formate/nitrite transporter FocA (FNT family)